MVQNLLAQLGESSTHIDTGLVAEGAASLLEQSTPQEMVGRLFGPYRVLLLLGRGGMGSVWLAERADGLFERQVALKLPNPSLIEGSLRERFSRERRILAALAHPNIARLIDAGVAEDDQPYLAIEYVEGTSLTEYCDQHQLTLRARLTLVMQVLAAVQHAHRNLVIHRDLKPTNILVTHDGQVRLLDFGIAKLIQHGDGLETDLTLRAGRALTLEYASPEQLSDQAITTSSDVYSLGIVLYTLLCGSRPYTLQRGSRGELEEAILSAQPQRPSHQAATEAIAHARATTPKALARALAGDLDTIVLKAIKKDPSERYASADALMEDLRRYLVGEPVLARPDSLSYRFVKYMVRNRAPLTVVALLVLVIVLGIGGTLTQAARAEQQARDARQARDEAVKELAFAEASTSFMRVILREMSGQNFTRAELLAHADALVAEQYGRDSRLRSRMQLVLNDLFNEQCDAESYHTVEDQSETSLASIAGPAANSSGIPDAPNRKLFLCVHKQGATESRSAKEVIDAFKRTVSYGVKTGVAYKAYWMGERGRTLYSLAEAPSNAAQRLLDEAPRSIANNVFEVITDNMTWSPTPGRKLFMDVHNPGPGQVTAKDLAANHEKDLAVQGKYGVRLLNYWFDADAGIIMCLFESPNIEAALATHREAHGNMPESIEEVTEYR